MGHPNTSNRAPGEGLGDGRPPGQGQWRRAGSRLAIRHLSREDRVRRGRAARDAVPFARHAEWDPRGDQKSPIDLLVEQAATRVPELVPIRHGRMLVSPFSYYRGAALAMASDLATTPSSGLSVQLCGDAHLANFGIFGSPERHLFFDVNDFDETAPGPWEWDVKRLAASLEVAGRDNGFRKKDRAAVVCGAVRSYRESMRDFSRRTMLDVWYAHMDMQELLPRFQSLLDPKRTPSVWEAIATARAHDSHQAFEKMCRILEGEARIVDDPPLIVSVAALMGNADLGTFHGPLDAVIRSYRRTLEPDRRQLLEHYQLVDVARKVVGVGSVGTDAWIALLLDRAQRTPLLLQVKQAEASVLERFTSPSEFSHHGQRVVAGQRLMQAASDIFLGWERFAWDNVARDYYVRQLRDWKGSADVPGMTPTGMALWGEMCGWTLARAHARTGDRIAIAAYLGKSHGFDRAIAEFAVAYAAQTERDYVSLQRAVSKGRLAARIGL